MNNSGFNVYRWLKKNNPRPDLHKSYRPPVREESVQTTGMEVEAVLEQIEAYQVDLTMNYQDWLTIGFAFAHEFGEGGRGYFHRVSRYHPGYSYRECDEKYNRILNRHQSGVTIRSFFWMAKHAGLDIRGSRQG